MSGGHFAYLQYRLSDVADSIRSAIDLNGVEQEYAYKTEFKEKTLKEFEEGIRLCELTQVYLQRIDWLISGDDGEETFHKRLAEDISKLKD